MKEWSNGFCVSCCFWSWENTSKIAIANKHISCQQFLTLMAKLKAFLAYFEISAHWTIYWSNQRKRHMWKGGRCLTISQTGFLLKSGSTVFRHQKMFRDFCTPSNPFWTFNLPLWGWCLHTSQAPRDLCSLHMCSVSKELISTLVRVTKKYHSNHRSGEHPRANWSRAVSIFLIGCIIGPVSRPGNGKNTLNFYLDGSPVAIYEWTTHPKSYQLNSWCFPMDHLDRWSRSSSATPTRDAMWAVPPWEESAFRSASWHVRWGWMMYQCDQCLGTPKAWEKLSTKF